MNKCALSSEVNDVSRTHLDGSARMESIYEIWIPNPQYPLEFYSKIVNKRSELRVSSMIDAFSTSSTSSRLDKEKGANFRSFVDAI